ncbi:collagen alpha-1(XII) chain-like [Labeo rohita]|uniref:collagen alpha-1(XII) chain-like n=1 Tax=Labeo rohita TaxID=84645 RepID=UPI0021E2E40B|nr:collagen alpha-1(XII) chain-like [Labeo rohita]
MRVRVLLVLILTSVLITHAQEDVFTCETPADIVILVDGSWSFGRVNFQTVRNFLESFVGSFTVGSNQTLVGLVQYSGDPRIEWHLNTHSTKEALINAVKNLPYKGGNTNTGFALTFILKNSFKAESGSRSDVPKIVILITDGKSQDDVLLPAQSLRDTGIELFAIGVKNADENELRAIASPPEETHVYNVDDFRFMLDIMEKLNRSVCERISELNREISVNIHTCETPAVADIVILVDGSRSIGRLNFKTVRSFLGLFVRAFAVGSEQTRIGLVLYSKDSWTEWHLDTHSTKGALTDAVKNLPYKGENTRTGLALMYILENSFKAESGSRSDVPKIVILITDGKSSDDVLLPAQSLRDAGIELFAMGVKDASVKELRAIASPPEETHVYNVDDFSFMLDIMKKLNRSVCERISELNREISVNIHTCETPAVADIVILVDGSWSIGRLNFKTVRIFLGLFVRAFAVGSEQTRIGLVLYSKDSWIEWHLNTHSTKGALTDAVKNLPYKGENTRTGRALTYILKNSFKAESGSRSDVPKIVILITDGKSQDDVLLPAQRLRDAGIELFAIGVKDADENELRAIASPPEETHVYNVDDFRFMLDIMEKLTRSVCERIFELNDTRSDAPSDLLTSEVTARRFCVTRPVNL